MRRKAETLRVASNANRHRGNVTTLGCTPIVSMTVWPISCHAHAVLNPAALAAASSPLRPPPPTRPALRRCRSPQLSPRYRPPPFGGWTGLGIVKHNALMLAKNCEFVPLGCDSTNKKELVSSRLHRDPNLKSAVRDGVSATGPGRALRSFGPGMASDGWIVGLVCNSLCSVRSSTC